MARTRSRIAGGASLILIGSMAFGAGSPILAGKPGGGGGTPGPGVTTGPTAIPTHVYSPYFETWTTDTLTATANASGVRYFTMAFLETTGRSSCTLAWDGVAADSVASGKYSADIDALRGLGGDVIPSFGGWSADQGGTEIGDSCSDVTSIFTAYQEVLAKYKVTRLDMDIEGRSLTKTAGIDRRNKAIAMLQAWATTNQYPLTISYTLPTSASGLEASGLAVLQNAKANGVRIDVVQPMVFDYYDRVTTDMGAAAVSALTGLNGQLQTLLGIDSAHAWALEGATIMNGVDDYPKKTEVTTLADAQKLLDLARLQHMSTLSMWAIQRDNGGCPGNGGANNCSGIVQPTWGFSNILNAYTNAP
ncbi:MAG TPA: chitinase [Candidatus Limnocylindrales bacterium]|nr:chitinase [Candidatus Limnocylindrales bacterium]